MEHCVVCYIAYSSFVVVEGLPQKPCTWHHIVQRGETHVCLYVCFLFLSLQLFLEQLSQHNSISVWVKWQLIKILWVFICNIAADSNFRVGADYFSILKGESMNDRQRESFPQVDVHVWQEDSFDESPYYWLQNKI